MQKVTQRFSFGRWLLCQTGYTLDTNISLFHKLTLNWKLLDWCTTCILVIMNYGNLRVILNLNQNLLTQKGRTKKKRIKTKMITILQCQEILISRWKASILISKWFLQFDFLTNFSWIQQRSCLMMFFNWSFTPNFNGSLTTVYLYYLYMQLQR